MPLRDCKKKAAEAFLGFFAMDVLNPPKGSVWGRFNDRTMDPPSIKTLTDKYKNRLDNCDLDTAMSAAVKASWVKNLGAVKTSEEVMALSIEELPMLELTPEGEKAILKEKLWFFSGNHRRTALKIHVDTLTKALEEEGVGAAASQQERNALIDAAKMKIEMSSRWAVRIYDRGEWCVSIDGKEGS